MEKQFKVTALTGIHARPATELVNTAVKYKSEISLGIDGHYVDFKSIIGVMSLGIYKNKVFTIKVNGEDEQEALEDIIKVLTTLNLAEEVK
ncbi:MAG: HPr family phosphocarrier protein [Erysipelotrichales bacterium]|nr:HPr family phosphocarrier protein [Erysipelotrichales bacterium]